MRCAHRRHQWVDNVPGWAVIRLATAQEVLDLEPDQISLVTSDKGGAAEQGGPGLAFGEDACRN
jgi:hypothetical protein